MTIASLSSGSEETVPRKTAENTVKHCDGGVGSVLGNNRGGDESSVVVTTVHMTTTKWNADKESTHAAEMTF